MPQTDTKKLLEWIEDRKQFLTSIGEEYGREFLEIDNLRTVIESGEFSLPSNKSEENIKEQAEAYRKRNEIHGLTCDKEIVNAFIAGSFSAPQSPGKEFELRLCEKCTQMTNHLDGICQKCKAQSPGREGEEWKEKYETAIQQKISLQKELDRLRDKYEPKGFANEYKGA